MPINDLPTAGISSYNDAKLRLSNNDIYDNPKNEQFFTSLFDNNSFYDIPKTKMVDNEKSFICPPLNPLPKNGLGTSVGRIGGNSKTSSSRHSGRSSSGVSSIASTSSLLYDRDNFGEEEEGDYVRYLSPLKCHRHDSSPDKCHQGAGSTVVDGHCPDVPTKLTARRYDGTLPPRRNEGGRGGCIKERALPPVPSADDRLTLSHALRASDSRLTGLASTLVDLMDRTTTNDGLCRLSQGFETCFGTLRAEVLTLDRCLLRFRLSPLASAKIERVRLQMVGAVGTLESGRSLAASLAAHHASAGRSSRHPRTGLGRVRLGLRALLSAASGTEPVGVAAIGYDASGTAATQVRNLLRAVLVVKGLIDDATGVVDFASEEPIPVASTTVYESIGLSPIVTSEVECVIGQDAVIDRLEPKVPSDNLRREHDYDGDDNKKSARDGLGIEDLASAIWNNLSLEDASLQANNYGFPPNFTSTAHVLSRHWQAYHLSNHKLCSTIDLTIPMLLSHVNHSIFDANLTNPDALRVIFMIIRLLANETRDSLRDLGEACYNLTPERASANYHVTRLSLSYDQIVDGTVQRFGLPSMNLSDERHVADTKDLLTCLRDASIISRDSVQESIFGPVEDRSRD